MLPIFLRNYPDCKAVVLKEYYDYLPISTCTEWSRNFSETIVAVKM
jgi:hypothetical protein